MIITPAKCNHYSERRNSYESYAVFEIMYTHVTGGIFGFKETHV